MKQRVVAWPVRVDGQATERILAQRDMSLSLARAQVENAVFVYICPYIKLRNSRPLAKVLDTLSNVFIRKYVKGFKANAVRIEDLHGRVAKSTLGEQFGTLHEEHDGISIH